MGPQANTAMGVGNSGDFRRSRTVFGLTPSSSATSCTPRKCSYWNNSKYQSKMKITLERALRWLWRSRQRRVPSRQLPGRAGHRAGDHALEPASNPRTSHTASGCSQTSAPSSRPRTPTGCRRRRSPRHSSRSRSHPGPSGTASRSPRTASPASSSGTTSGLPRSGSATALRRATASSSSGTRGSATYPPLEPPYRNKPHHQTALAKPMLRLLRLWRGARSEHHPHLPDWRSRPGRPPLRCPTQSRHRRVHPRRPGRICGKRAGGQGSRRLRRHRPGPRVLRAALSLAGGEGGMTGLGPNARQDALRVLERAARLLAAQVNGDALDSAAGRNDSAIDDGADEVALLVGRQPLPVTSRNGDCGHERAA
jgi:hypothetical protein